MVHLVFGHLVAGWDNLSVGKKKKWIGDSQHKKSHSPTLRATESKTYREKGVKTCED